jgi:DNA polymerase III subunit gamma/tau
MFFVTLTTHLRQSFMNSFIVSARKYRPSTFKTVVGQDYIVTTLKNAIKNNQLAQAFLFTGPRGVGKTTCARILAKTINCTNITPDFEACNECESCRSFNEFASFNVHELDAASNNSVDDIRTLVDQVRIPPQAGLYKIYIIDEVHMLSASAFNAFLKTLEEPPSYAKFILATTDKHKIIPTILSRCQVFDFKRITVDDIAKHLAYVAQKENIEFEPQAFHIIATKSDGALRDALSIFDQMVSYGSNKITVRDVIENLNILDYEYHFRLVDATLNGDTTSILLIIEEIYEKGFDGQSVITGMGDHLRSLLVCKDEKTVSLLEVHEDLVHQYLRQSKACTVRFLIKALDIMNSCDLTYKAAVNKRFHMELALLKIAQLNEQQAVSSDNSVLKPEKTQPSNQVQITSSQKQEANTKDNPHASDTKENYHAKTEQQTKIDSVNDPDDICVTDSIKAKAALKPDLSNMNKPYSDEDVQAAYEKFCSGLKENDNKSYEYSVIQNAKFEKVHEEEWKLVLGSPAETEAFRGLDMQSWFRETLNNKYFSILFVSEQRTEQKNSKSRDEKVKEFIASHPEIQKFMQELDAIPDL